jgi:lipopolysaccharide/colanic/teichoic acid biosynthesis glycosyltransferase
MKRVFDVMGAGIGFVLLTPLLFLVALLIKLDSPGSVFFQQERIGKGFRPFCIYKFRTMLPDAPRKGGAITVGNDPRITRVGRILRKTKLDELPQLLNVLKGDMSFVGPRPEVQLYVELFRKDYEEILTVRPGITDLASLKYRHEAELLGQAENPEAMYITQVLPEKIRLAKEYVKQSSFGFDVIVILKTLLQLFKSVPE